MTRVTGPFRRLQSEPVIERISDVCLLVSSDLKAVFVIVCENVYKSLRLYINIILKERQLPNLELLTEVEFGSREEGDADTACTASRFYCFAYRESLSRRY